MNKGKFLALILIVAAFAAGLGLGKGRQESSAPVAVSSGGSGANYGGGFSAADNAFTLSGNSKSVAGPPMTDVIVVVNDGESIQQAVQNAEPGTTIQVMPGTYKETVFIDKDGIRLIGIIRDSQRPAKTFFPAND